MSNEVFDLKPTSPRWEHDSASVGVMIDIQTLWIGSRDPLDIAIGVACEYENIPL